MKTGFMLVWIALILLLSAQTIPICIASLVGNAWKTRGPMERLGGVLILAVTLLVTIFFVLLFVMIATSNRGV